ncbi:MAG: NPXTG-anchored protein, partial [Ruminococcus sp.]|nr:NPXTG-anchored protein [Ruminococcus sp.]
VNADGAEVEPNGKVTVSIPVPDGFTEPAVYRIIDGKKVLMSGTVTDGMYTFATKTSGEYAVVNAKSDDNSGTSSNSSAGNNSSKSSKSSSGTNTANPATGAAGAASAAAALALGAVVVSKKRKSK